MKKCESCGKPYSESKDVFCPHCGAVASKKCTHGSSFDSSRWDRGEIYKNAENSYSAGSEPHAQRADLNEPYSAPASDEYGKGNKTIRLPGEIGSKALKKIIGAVGLLVVALPLIISFFDMGFDFSDYDTGSDWYGENYYETTEEDTAFVGKASVVTEPWGEDWFIFDLVIEDIYINGFELGYTDTLQTYGFEGEIDLTTYNIEDVELANYESTGSYNYTGMQDGESGRIDFSEMNFGYDQIIVVNELILYNFYGEISVQLPFDAFSCDDDGAVTYYRLDEYNYFEECEPEAEIEDYDTYFSFSTGEVVINNLTEVVSVVPDEYQEN